MKSPDYRRYDLKKYNFHEQVSLKLGSTLEYLHTVTKNSSVIVDLKKQQHTDWHKLFYNNIRDSEFLKTYKSFVIEYIKPYFNTSEIIYQKVPTFRIQYPHNTAIAEFHKDSDYAHSKEEVNFFVPLTSCKDTNAIWVESDIGSKKYLPMEADPGDFVIWDGANLMHGNKVSVEHWTRVSFDFRAMTLAAYEAHEQDVIKSGKESVVGSVPMLLGEYYEKI
jgi:ectoine hydroxylase-related dioxygenase (phytanoyl-CoA dioxygenase family)